MNSQLESNVNNTHEYDFKKVTHCPLISKCGESGQIVFPDGTLGGASAAVATVSIDYSKFCNPCTKLEFTSSIIGTAFAGTINFQVFRLCSNEQLIPIGAQFSFSVPEAALFSTMFTFFVCDCDSCSDECCTYIVVVTVAGVSITGNVGIFAARLAATTVDNQECSC